MIDIPYALLDFQKSLFEMFAARTDGQENMFKDCCIIPIEGASMPVPFTELGWQITISRSE